MQLDYSYLRLQWLVAGTAIHGIPALGGGAMVVAHPGHMTLGEPGAVAVVPGQSGWP